MTIPTTTADNEGPSAQSTKEDETDRIVVSFCAAWISTIAYHRELISGKHFRRVSFGNASTLALLCPSKTEFSITHRGLYDFLTQDAAGMIRGQGDVAVRVVLRKDGKIVEVHEMRCVQVGGNVEQDELRGQVGDVLRIVSIVVGSGNIVGVDASIEVGTEEISGMRTISAGVVLAGACEIRCAVYLVDEA